MNGKPKISIIIAVYNAEKYLDKCLNSILSQSFNDFEIILVNDGSKDNSREICNRYAQKDQRIRAFHKNNSGVSKTRQFGLEKSIGEYVIHIDPDDWIESKMLEELYNKATIDNADMVICDFFMNEKKETYIRQEPISLEADKVLNNLFTGLHGSCCNKLVRRYCFEKYNVSFPTTFNLYEDLYVNASLLCNDIKVSYLNKAFYHYMLLSSNTSVTKRIDRKSVNEDKIFADSMLELLADRPVTKDLFMKSLSYSIVLKGYKSKVYSTKEFVKEFKPFRKYIFASKNGNFIAKCICYISCYGFYGIFKHLH